VRWDGVDCAAGLWGSGRGALGEGDGSTGRVHREGETKRETKRERLEATRWSGVVGGAVVAGLSTASDTALRHYGMAWPTTGTSSEVGSEQAGSGWRVTSVQGASRCTCTGSG
jgi:hypothetical protein